MKDGALTLDFARESRRLRISFFEGGEKALRPYVIHDPAWEQIDAKCRDLLALLNRFNRSATPGAEFLNRLKKTGHVLYDLLLPSQIKEKLATTGVRILTLRLEDNLVHIPWELLHDGEDFLCCRFATGRIASTAQTPTSRSIRAPTVPFNVLIIADPRGDLPAAYQEGLEIKAFLDSRRNVFRVDFKSDPVDIAFVKQNLRDYDIVHYAGHARYDAGNPSASGWLLSDGTLKADEIAALGGLQPMPALVFANGCQSGQTGEWNGGEREQPIFGLADAFLLAGVQHYVGTFREFIDISNAEFAKRFYSAIANGDSVGVALYNARRSRLDSGGAETLAWANYMLYGDPSREYRGVEIFGKDSIEQKRGRWRQIFQAAKLPVNLGSSPLTLLLMAAAAVSMMYGAYAQFYSGVSPGGTITAPQSAMTVAPVTPPVNAPLSLSMNIIGQRKEPDGSYSEVVVREGSVLQSGDNFQVHVETNRPSHVYVLLFDSQGRASQLFPDPKIEQQGFIDPSRRVAVPDRDLWFWLDDQPGTETVYVLASEGPLADIRGLLLKMDRANETERKQLSGEIKQRIKIVERGVSGIAKGKTVTYPLSDGQRVQKVTEIVAGAGAVVRAISFEHR